LEIASKPNSVISRGRHANSSPDALDRKIKPELPAVLPTSRCQEWTGSKLLVEIEQRFPDLPVIMVSALVTTSGGGAAENWLQIASWPSSFRLCVGGWPELCCSRG
jgi:hypothetical protein